MSPSGSSDCHPAHLPFASLHYMYVEWSKELQLEWRFQWRLAKGGWSLTKPYYSRCPFLVGLHTAGHMRYASNQTCQNKQGRHDLLTCQKDSLIICKLTSPRMARCHRWRQGENARYNLPLPWQWQVISSVFCHSLSFTSGLQWSRRRCVNEAFVS